MFRSNATSFLAKRQHQSGFSLIELLVAVLIMAFGILGVAGLQVISLQQNRAALYRAEAVQLANDLMDRIRVNPNVTYTAAIDADPAATTSCIANSCSPADMRDYDITQWKCAINSVDVDGNTFPVCDANNFNIEGALPDGAGSVLLVAGVYVITVQWDDDGDGVNDSIELQARVN